MIAIACAVAVAFACGAVSHFCFSQMTQAECDAVADAVLLFRKQLGEKNLPAYRLGQLLERHGRLNAVGRRRRELTRWQWIPVGEQLPQDNVAVLVNRDPGGVEMAFRQDGQWGISHTNVLGSGSAYTHWMSLPAPPDEVR